MKSHLMAALILLGSTTLSGAFDPEGAHCVWYGVCGPDPTLPPATAARHCLNCKYEGSANLLPLEYESILDEACPHLRNDLGGDLRLCCSPQQLLDLKNNFEFANALLGRCPTCMYNFRKNFCDMTCRPDQSKFLKTKLIEGLKKPCNLSTKTGDDEIVVMVKEVEYFMNATFAEKVYDSCKNVYCPAFGAPAIMAMCGTWGAELCTFRRFFEFLGDVVNNGFVPFQISYNFDETPEGIEPQNSKVIPCNEAIDDQINACACIDCPEACSI